MVAIHRGPGLGSLITALALVMNQFAYAAYDLDVNSLDSVKTITKQLAKDMLSFYHGDEPGGTPGILPEKYYWWEAGAMFGSLIDYWYYTGDDTFNELTTTGLLFQVGENRDYMPRNQTLTEGNDDQGFWGLAVMSAAEYSYPDPPPDQPQWLALAQAVFNTQAARWETEHCGGGLRWQIFEWNKGYDYKNSISQACFFALAARLALYTGNQTYADWAEKTWDWMAAVEFIDPQYWVVYDGAAIGSNCTDITPYQFTYNAGGMLHGAAAMYNFTEDDKWGQRVDNLVEGTKVFFTGPNNDIMTEVACEPVDLCNIDQQSFKAYLSRWMAVTTQWRPSTYDTIAPLLEASAKAAVDQCVGGDNGRMCGLHWNENKYDGSTGIGQQMCALEVTLSTQIKGRAAPLTEDTGGTSRGDPSAGGDDIGRDSPAPVYGPPTAGDIAGGAIVTVVIVLGIIASTLYLFLDEESGKSTLSQLKGLATGGVGAMGAAMKRRGGDNSKVAEKNAATARAGSPSDNNSSISGDRPIEQLPITIGHVRNTSSTSQPRRMSNMPLGWPRNSMARPRAPGDTGSDRGSFQDAPESHGISQQYHAR